MALQRKTKASFVWDIVGKNLKLLGYPFVRIICGVLLLAAMWSLIFDVSAMEVGQVATGVVNEAFQGQGDSSSNSSTPEQQQLANKVQNLAGHTHFGYLILFVLINAFVGLISVGAVNAQALALSRSENRSFLYGYSMALLRLPQLFLWWLVTVIVGAILNAIEQHRLVGLIIGSILGFAWTILTYFAITAIMATGSGPFTAIGQSKKTVTDVVKKIYGSDSGVDMKTLRVGLRIGGPLFVISLFLGMACLALLFVDARALHGGGHGVTAGALGTLFVLLLVNGAFASAMVAILKAVLYVWAEEDQVMEGVDTEQLGHAFIAPHQKTASPSLASP